MNISEDIQTTISGYSGEDFINQFEEICGNLSQKYSILCFAIIIYDETNPEFRKIFRDKDYWDALVKSSAERLLVFTLKDSIETEYETQMHLMTSFNAVSPSKSKSYSKLLNKVFGDKARLAYPSVLFFQIENGSVSNYRLIPLSRKSVWDSCVSLQDLFKSISDVLDKILPENFCNKDEIFELIKSELLRQKYTMYILRGPMIISDLIGIIKNLTLS